MTKMPNEIWAWFFNERMQSDAIAGGWTDQEDYREVKYIRADAMSDLCEQLVEAIKPFADFARAHAVDAPEWTDQDHIKVIVSIGDLRAVASAIDAYEASK